MKVLYTVENFLKDNLALYKSVKHYVDNYGEIFVKRAKKVYPHEKCNFFRKISKTDKDFYVDYVSNEKLLGTDEIEFLVDLNFARNFCKTISHLINYSGLRYEIVGDEVVFTYIEKTDFLKSVFEVEQKDLKNIKRSKLFIGKYFE